MFPDNTKQFLTVFVSDGTSHFVTVKSIFCLISIITLACDHFFIVDANYM